MSTRPRPRHRRHRRHLGRILLFSCLLIAALYAGLRCFLLQEPEQKDPSFTEGLSTQTGQSQQTPVDEAAQSLHSHQERKPYFYTILVSGVDDDNGGSDTNILVALDTEAGSLYGVSIPRDTKAVWGGKSYKINAAYNIGGMEKLSCVITDQLGIPVDYTVLVDLKGFVALVDAIGGVDFEVPIDMHYEDPYQNLYIHIPKGMQHLSGSEALKVVRFRKGYASQDIGRMQTQQAFLKAVAKQLLQVSNLTKIDDFVRIFQQYVETDLTVGNLAWLGNEVMSMGAENIQFSTLPGQWKDPYIYLDPEETLALVNEHLNPYVEDRIAADLNIPS